MNTTSWLGLVAGAVLTMLLLAVGHWFPWLDRERKIRNYTYGTTSIILGFALWRAVAGDWISVAGLALIAVAGGAMVVIAYEIDHVALRMRQARMAERADDDLPEM